MAQTSDDLTAPVSFEAGPTPLGQQSGFSIGWALIKRYARLHPRPFTLAVSGSAVFALATVGSSWALAKLTDDVITPAFAGKEPPVIGVFLLFSLMGLMRVISAVVRRSNAAFLRADNLATWQKKVVRQLTDQPMSFFRRRSTGDLLSAAETDADAAVTILSPLPFALGVIVLLTTSAAWMISIDWVLGLLALILLPFLAFSNQFFERYVEAPVKQIQTDLAALSGSVHELVDGFSAIKALGLEERTRAEVHGDINRVAASKIRALKVRSVFEAAQEVLLPTVNVGVLLLGAYRVRDDALTIGQVAGVLGLFNLLVWPLRLLAWTLADLPRSVAGATRIDELLSVPVPSSMKRVAPTNDKHAYELVDVSLVHDDGRIALDRVTLNIRRGSKIAVVGATGSGKSTLLDVLSGLERPSSGVIRVASDTSAMVFQEPLVLSGPVHDNLTLRLPTDPAAIEEGLSVAEAHFIDALPSGRATVVGERGITLSGGQRQRVALARAIARRSPVLLLDDTTSSLDAETEERVLAGLAGLGRDQTLVLVAARPSSISFADEVLVLSEGRVVAFGPHAEVLAVSPEYRSLMEALSGSGDTASARS
jgi:ATP-binding cassette, subfamily B, bacterial